MDRHAVAVRLRDHFATEFNQDELGGAQHVATFALGIEVALHHPGWARDFAIGAGLSEAVRKDAADVLVEATL